MVNSILAIIVGAIGIARIILPDDIAEWEELNSRMWGTEYDG